MEMDVMWDKIKKGLKDGATMSVEKIEEYTKIGKLKIDELSAKRKIDRNFLDIGERSYECIVGGKGDGIGSDLAVLKSVENIKALKMELVSIADKIQQISDEAKKNKRGSAYDDEEAVGI